MSIKRSVRVSAIALAMLMGAAALSGCMAIYEGADSVCPGGNRNADNWPYCGSAEPGR
jgi:hypothetical protein